MSRVVTETLVAVARAAGRGAVSCGEADPWYANAEAETHIFSYRKDFSALWGIGERGNMRSGLEALVNGLAGRQVTLLVVWDGQPDDAAADGVDVGHYVTPYEWAVALSLALHRRYRNGSKPGRRPMVRIMIVDIGSPRTRDGFVQRAFFSFHNTFPWIQDYRPVATGSAVLAEAAEDDTEIYSRLRQGIPPERRDVVCLIKDLSQSERILPTFNDGEDYLPRLEAFADSWRQEFIRPMNRHSVANLVGPMILSEGLPGKCRTLALRIIEGSALPRRVLHGLIAMLGLLEETHPEGPSARERPDEGGIRIAGRVNVRWLLVDDQYALGYHHILGCALFGEDYSLDQARMVDGKWRYEGRSSTLTCVEVWGPLVQTLATLSPVLNWDMPRCISIPDCDVLLLDLRLWLDDQMDLRTRFFQDLTRVCHNLNARSIENPRFQSAFNAAAKIASEGEGSELAAITLLPLLLSHYDPSLPIVIFSSTHQRDVMELMRDRPNIITIFSKPLITGYGDNKSPVEMVGDLYSSLALAVTLHEARLVWEKLCEADWNWAPPFRIGEQRYNATSEPRGGPLSAEHLRRALAVYYVEYVQKERYYDFASIPYEFIEATLKAGVVQQQRGFNEFGLMIKGAGRGHSHNLVALALRDTRNRKDHGDAKPPTDRRESEEWRIATLLVFRILIDYLGASETQVGGAGAVIDKWVKAHQAEIGQSSSYRRGGHQGSRHTMLPADLSQTGKMPWLPFVVYAVLYWIKVAANSGSGRIPVSESTWLAIGCVIGNVIEEVDIAGAISPASGPADDSEEFDVVRHCETGFYVGKDGAECGFCESERRPAIGTAVWVIFDRSRITKMGFYHVRLVG